MRKRALAGIGLVAVVAAAGGSSPWWAPRVLPRIPGFAAERVEVAGTRLLAPHDVLAASGIRMGESLWTDPSGWEAALRRHPAIAAAVVERRLPHTLRIQVTEKRPAALVEGATLVPVTADGEVLPLDPARVPVDLPLARGRSDRGRDGRMKDAGMRTVLAETQRISDLDPALAARISEVRAGRPGELRLTLSNPDAEVVVPVGAQSDRLLRLDAALADVSHRLASLGGRPSTPVSVDLRFEDQVVVRMPQAAPAAPAPVPAPAAAAPAPPSALR